MFHFAFKPTCGRCYINRAIRSSERPRIPRLAPRVPHDLVPLKFSPRCITQSNAIPIVYYWDLIYKNSEVMNRRFSGRGSCIQSSNTIILLLQKNLTLFSLSKTK